MDASAVPLFGAVLRVFEISDRIGDRSIALAKGAATPGDGEFYTEDSPGGSRQRS
ncbi:MAG: hypothetical protein P8Y27_14790 [Chromatiaceae bacterium]|jgi:hypothetical protein